MGCLINERIMELGSYVYYSCIIFVYFFENINYVFLEIGLNIN